GDHPWRSYTRLAYPEFDLCASVAERTFDVVICEQVLEHIPDPWVGARTLYDLCRPGGHVIVSTPFLIKVHNEPDDFWRFTVAGLRLLLEKAHLEVVTLKSWGNRSCARANFHHWVARRPWQSMENEELFPIVVWAVARRPVAESSGPGPAPIGRPSRTEDETGPVDS
ncbi:MAG: class I SAM-dependent methyltransferase, partial [Nocardioides sp.]